MFITHQSIGLPDASREPAGIPSCLPACSPGLVWEIDCSRCAILAIALFCLIHDLRSFNLRTVQWRRIRDRSVACQAACSQVQSKPSRTQRRRQLGCSIPESHNADVAELNDPKKVAQSIDRDLKQSDTEDPNTVGFVPAFMLGNIYVCKVPERQVPASLPCKQATGAQESSTITCPKQHFMHPPARCMHCCLQSSVCWKLTLLKSNIMQKQQEQVNGRRQH